MQPAKESIKFHRLPLGLLKVHTLQAVNVTVFESVILVYDVEKMHKANKPIQDFRDTFGGIKSLPMRGKETRKRCKNSREKN
jgi:hypothetical protein